MPHNEALWCDFSKFLYMAMICMTLGRILLILVSYKYENICRIYFYYQVVYLTLEWCLPRNYGNM